MSLDFTLFSKVLDSLDRSLTRWQTAPAEEELRDAASNALNTDLNWPGK